MLKSFNYRWFNEVLNEALQSKTKRGSRGYFSKWYIFSEMICHPFYRERLPAACVCVLSFVDSKAQLQYLGSPSTAVPP